MNPSSGFGGMFDNGSSGFAANHNATSSSGGVSSTVSSDYGHLAMNSVLPYSNTNVRNRTYTNNSDFIQPGLSQLQPNLEDILSMDYDLDSQHAWPQEAPQAQSQTETLQQSTQVQAVQKPALQMQYPAMQQTPSPNPTPPAAASPSPNLTTLGLEVVNYDQHHQQQQPPQQQPQPLPQASAP